MSLWFCAWGVWEDYETGDIVTNGKRIGVFISQKRTCKDCKMVQLRTIKTTVYD